MIYPAVSSISRHSRAGDIQWANMPFLPLREKEAEKFVLYGVLSLLNRILGKGDVDQRMMHNLGDFTYVAIDTMNYISWRQVWNLRVSLHDVVCECLDKRFPFFLGLPEHWFLRNRVSVSEIPTTKTCKVADTIQFEPETFGDERSELVTGHGLTTPCHYTLVS